MWKGKRRVKIWWLIYCIATKEEWQCTPKMLLWSVCPVKGPHDMMLVCWRSVANNNHLPDGLLDLYILDFISMKFEYSTVLGSDLIWQPTQSVPEQQQSCWTQSFIMCLTIRNNTCMAFLLIWMVFCLIGNVYNDVKMECKGSHCFYTA